MGKCLNTSFIETTEVFKLKVGTTSWLSEYTKTYEYKGQGHCLTFVEGHSDLYFQASSAAQPIEAKFDVEPL